MAQKKVTTYEGLGPGTLIPERATLPKAPALSAEEGFVLSRVDGKTSLADVCLLVPFEEKVTVGVLRKLWEAGVIDLPGVERPPPLVDGLGAEQVKRIDEFFASLDKRNAFELLEVSRQADAKEIRRAYFKLSKEFHPDRFYGQVVGEHAKRLSAIFQAVKAAFELLTDEQRRAAYIDSLPPPR